MNRLENIAEPESKLVVKSDRAAELITEENIEILRLVSAHSSMSVQSIADSLEEEKTQIEKKIKELFENGFLEAVEEGSYKGFKISHDAIQITFEDVEMKSDD